MCGCVCVCVGVADAGPDLCTLHPDLWTLCLWCFSSFKWCKHSTCTGDGCHQLQLALVVHFYPPTGANTALAPGQLALCGGGQWWWYVVACGGGGIYIYFRNLKPYDGRKMGQPLKIFEKNNKNVGMAQKGQKQEGMSW